MATETLRPNAAGDETNIGTQIPSSGSHWDKVDEVTADDLDTRVYHNSETYGRDLYNLSDSTGYGTINKITLYFTVAIGGTGGDCVKGVIKAGTTIVETGAKSPHADFGSWVFGTYSQDWVTNPNTDSAWTWDEIDGLQAGVALKNAGGSSANCTQIYVEVDSSPVASNAVQTKWNVRGLVSDTSIYKWNVIRFVSKTVQAKWNVLTLVNKTLQSIWNILITVNGTFQVIFNVRSLVSRSNQYIWNVFVVTYLIAKTLELQWYNILRILKLKAYMGQGLNIKFNFKTGLGLIAKSKKALKIIKRTLGG